MIKKILYTAAIIAVFYGTTDKPVSIKHEMCLSNCKRTQIVCRKVFDEIECTNEYKYCINVCEYFKGR